MESTQKCYLFNLFSHLSMHWEYFKSSKSFQFILAGYFYLYYLPKEKCTSNCLQIVLDTAVGFLQMIFTTTLCLQVGQFWPLLIQVYYNQF